MKWNVEFGSSSLGQTLRRSFREQTFKKKQSLNKTAVVISYHQLTVSCWHVLCVCGLVLSSCPLVRGCRPRPSPTWHQLRSAPGLQVAVATLPLNGIVYDVYADCCSELRWGEGFCWEVALSHETWMKDRKSNGSSIPHIVLLLEQVWSSHYK